MLFYPMEYWHQTMNLDTPTVSITGTLVTPNDFVHVAAELKRQCDGQGSIFNPDPSMCSQLEHCFALWTSQFGTDEL